MMIATDVADEIRELLGSGQLSQRKIALRVGVSRGTVNAIALGRRPDYPARHGGPSDDFIPPTGPPRRCPGCGAKVRMPCLACHVRAIQRRRRTAGRPRN